MTNEFKVSASFSPSTGLILVKTSGGGVFPQNFKLPFDGKNVLIQEIQGVEKTKVLPTPQEIATSLAQEKASLEKQLADAKIQLDVLQKQNDELKQTSTGS